MVHGAKDALVSFAVVGVVLIEKMESYSKN